MPSWSLALAASVVLLVTFVFIFNTNGPTAESLLAEVSETELLAYLDQIELDEYDIALTVGDQTDILELDQFDVLQGIELEDQVFDDVLFEYDLEEDEYL